jgi:tRNA (mo5U34)-methyltransferase
VASIGQPSAAVAEADAALRARVAEIEWFHSIEVAPGLVTPGHDPTSERVQILGLPDSLAGQTVLDVGAWDGFFSFEAERRGASRVLATDSFAWSGQNWSSKAGLQLAREALGSRVEDQDIDVMDLAPEAVGVWDVVLCLGVLYHMRHPLLALEKVASVTGRQLILETHVDAAMSRRPAMVFYPGHELDLDPTNWWGPNPAAVVAMLHAVGFDVVEIVSPYSFAYRAGRLVRRTSRFLGHVARHRTAPPEHPAQGRVVVHAFRA